MRMPTRLGVMGIGLALFVPATIAAPPAPEGTPEPLRKIYEVVTQTPRRTPQTPFSAPRAVDVIGGKKAVREGARSLPDMLEGLLGVLVQRTNRGAGAPIIRGLVGPQNLILVDGVRFNTGTFRTGPNQYLALLDPYAIQRMEVVRGASSVLYGNGAMGGVLQVFLREPLTPPERGFGMQGMISGRFAVADLGAGGTFYLTGGGW